MSWPDYFSGHARDYARYRPRYPDSLFETLAHGCARRDVAWDCGAGNGQAARSLELLFTRVVATDASPDQLRSADAGGFARVACRAEAAALASDCVDLVVVAQAIHWFADARFFAEVARVASPGATLACWCYELLRVDPAIDRIVRRLYRDPLGPYWAPERRHIDSGLTTVEVPFPELPTPEITMRATWSLEDLLGYVATWSALKRYQAATGADAMTPLRAAIEPLWGEGSREVTWPLAMRWFRI